MIGPMSTRPLGIACPHCGAADHTVVKTYQERGYIRRRRLCGPCGHRFTSIERLPNQAPPARVDKDVVADGIRLLIDACGLKGHI